MSTQPSTRIVNGREFRVVHIPTAAPATQEVRPFGADLRRHVHRDRNMRRALHSESQEG